MEQEILDTIDNGESEVQLTTIGTVIGTGADGSPVEQHLTEESLKKLAELHKDDEILVDADHESEMGGKTEAKGWLSKLFVKPGVGLFGKIKWTDIGRKLIENRVFRWLSPSWLLNRDTKEPVEMTSVALTNKPSQAGRIDPIVNSAPVSLYAEQDTIELSTENGGTYIMTKEELIQLIKDTIADMKKEEAVQKVEEEIKTENEIHEDAIECLEEKKEAVETGAVNPEDVLNSQPTTEEPVNNACSEEVDSQGESIKNECGDKTEETKNEEADDDKTETEDKTDDDKKKEEVKEKVEEKKEDEAEKKEEVIPLEALNSAPKTDGVDIVKGGTQSWQKLSGQAFIDWVNNGMK